MRQSAIFAQGSDRALTRVSHALATISAMKKTSHATHADCPCESGQAYGVCCGRWHAGLAEGVRAPTPEALMRSRYSAYVLGLLDYLLATWHPSTAPGDLELPPVKWLGLELRHAQATGDAGVVEFVARCRDGGRGVRLHEISRFVREDGRWLYIDGDQQDQG
jgi:SEC-C motif-containing protein